MCSGPKNKKKTAQQRKYQYLPAEQEIAKLTNRL